MTGIYDSLARGRRVYNRLIGGLAGAQTGLPGQQSQAEAGHQAVSAMSEWTPVPGLAEREGTAFFPPLGLELEDEAPAVGFSLSPNPPDPLETAELFEQAAGQEERFVCQNLRREER